MVPPRGEVPRRPYYVQSENALEQAVQAGTPTAYLDLLTESADIDRARRFATEEFRSGATNVAYDDGTRVDVDVPMTERSVEQRVALAGALRSVDISKDDGTLAEISKS
jgi:hypothetical protein